MTEEYEESAMMKFELFRAAVGDGATARLGCLTTAGRSVVETPNFFGLTSRGVVPHITPDNLSKYVQIGGVYIALEDFIERPQRKQAAAAPILKMPPPQHTKPLHAFTAMPPSVITVMSARRHPAVAVAAPTGNTHNSVSVYTSTGFSILQVEDYHAAVRTLEPDIGIPLVDLSHKTVKQNSKRAMRLAERTEDWVRRWFDDLGPSSSSNSTTTTTTTSTFVPILPVSYDMQWEYLQRLEEEDYLPRISGLALHDVDILPDLAANHPALLPLPRLSLDAPATPHHVLRQIALGIDVFMLPFVNKVSDSGVALTFTFPAPTTTSDGINSTLLLPLGIDMSSPTSGSGSGSAHATSTAPLLEGCDCYTCTRHHRAYVTHLLATREMLGWTLLQLHNHRVVARFFAGVRAVLAQARNRQDRQDAGGDRDDETVFEAECRRFAAVYDPEFPEGAGPRPRARGYHFKSDGADGRLNRPAWGRLGQDDDEVVGDEASGDGDEEVLPGEGNGSGNDDNGNDMAETPVVPDGDEDARELDRKGFAEIDGKEI